MEFAISAARWVVGKALAPVADGVLQAWAASEGLGGNVDALTTELQYAEAMLKNARGREIDNPSLNELLHKLRGLAYDADDVLDKLDYFRIQDVLDGTSHAAGAHAGGCVPGLALHARHTVRAVAGKLKPSFSKKLKFQRVEISRKMEDITEHLKPVCAKVFTILNLELLGSKSTTAAAMERPTTWEEILEPKLYGRENQQKIVVDGITHGEYFDNCELTVLPIVGPGGIGKTTFIQYVYQEVKSHFQVTVWICVSLNFDANRLAREAAEKIPKIEGENNNWSDHEKIEQRLKDKRFLVVLDDMWNCQEDEWDKLLAPFRKGKARGNMIIVTTRIPDVVEKVKTVHPIELKCLEDKDMMHFFEACVFGQKEPWKDYLELHDIGEKIVRKLKGSPLAAKTVGRLLKKQLTIGHWTRVLESKEWELVTSSNDIMPALKISYDYLPLYLKPCFSYCALFPEDHEFDSKELIHFWIGLDVLHSVDQCKRIEDIGQEYLIDLVNYGFFKKHEENGQQYYVMHDLLHDLAVKVSQYDCLSIQISKVRSTQIPASVRHLSIIVNDEDVEDRMTYTDYKNDVSAIDTRLKVESLRTLMLFGERVECFARTFGNLFKEARALRTILFSGGSYNVEDMLPNFSELVHLRYLRIKRKRWEIISLPGTISMLYHLKILDIESSYDCTSPSRCLSNIVRMQHFIVPNSRLHSEIFNVGKMKLLRELRSFEVRKERNGFELKELGPLLELESLGIYNLEKVKTKEEAADVKLTQKHHLQELTLVWDDESSNKDPKQGVCSAMLAVQRLMLQLRHPESAAQPAANTAKQSQEENVLENLRPQSNLCKLSIKGHRGTTCPKWLGVDLSVKKLEFLRLDDVSWKTLPPLGELWLVNEHGEEYLSCSIRGEKFEKLKRLELVKISKLKKWTRNGPCELLSHLEELIIEDCPELKELPFSPQTGREHAAHMIPFPKLEKLEIVDCPNLSSLSCIIPWSSDKCSTKIEGVGSCIKRLSYKGSPTYSLEIKGNDVSDSAFWGVLAFQNLSKLESMTVKSCPPLSVDHLQKLSSLKSLEIRDSSSAFCLAERDGPVTHECPVEQIAIRKCGASGEQLTRQLSYFPKLLSLTMDECEKVTRLGVRVQQKRTEAHAQPPSCSINEVKEAQVVLQEQQQGASGDQEIAAASEGLLLLPSQLQNLVIYNCPKLVLWPDSFEDDKVAGRTGGGGGLPSLRSLRSFEISGCPKFLSSYVSSSASCPPFPNSLESLYLRDLEGTETLQRLSNLTSLTKLWIWGCGDLRGEGLWPLLAQGRLIKLTVRETPTFFAGSEPSLPHEKDFPSASSKLQELWTDDVAGFLAAPICPLLSSSLTELYFWGDKKVERFTKEQEDALQLLTSLENINIWSCDKLQCLPAGLHRLPKLKSLSIQYCAAIRSLPKCGLTSSLQELEIEGCPAIRSLPKDCLPSSLQKLEISDCPAIRSLPKVDDLPSSLRVLDVRDSESEELRKQCRKFIGTIPIVIA